MSNIVIDSRGDPFVRTTIDIRLDIKEYLCDRNVNVKALVNSLLQQVMDADIIPAEKYVPILRRKGKKTVRKTTLRRSLVLIGQTLDRQWYLVERTEQCRRNHPLACELKDVFISCSEYHVDKDVVTLYEKEKQCDTNAICAK